jgi:hypothetical protein
MKDENIFQYVIYSGRSHFTEAELWFNIINWDVKSTNAFLLWTDTHN